MFEETLSVPSIWASMNSWFTPAVLFVLLNLMIGTIAVTSGLGTHKHQQQSKDDPQPQLARSPSVLQRLKSFNLYRYRSHETTASSSTITTTVKPTPESEAYYALKQPREAEQAPELQEPETIEDGLEPPLEEDDEEEREVEDGRTTDDVYGMIQGRHVSRVKSDTRPASGEAPVRLQRKMKKSASAKSAFAHSEERDVVERRRPATVREGRARATEAEHFGDDDAVDAKADDFINKFKQQLKLQKLNSIMQDQEMLNRRSEK